MEFTNPNPNVTELTDEEIDRLYANVPANVDKMCQKLGVPMSYDQITDIDTGLVFDGRLPAELHRMTVDILSKYMHYVINEYSRIAPYAKQYNEQKTVAEIKLVKKRAQLLKNSRGSNKDIRDANVELDRRLVMIESDQLFFTFMSKRLDMALDILQKAYNDISRQISTQETAMGMHNRYGSLVNFGEGAQPNLPVRAPWSRPSGPIPPGGSGGV